MHVGFFFFFRLFDQCEIKYYYTKPVFEKIENLYLRKEKINENETITLL